MRGSAVAVSDIVNSLACDVTSEDCCSQLCRDCGDHLPSSFLIEGKDVDDDEEATWTLWKNINRKVALETVSGTSIGLLYEIDEGWKAFVHHAFINQQQRKYIEEIREKSSDSGFLVVQVDFAENYKFVRQREPQSAHWNTDQATLFTTHFKIGSQHRCMVLISDYMDHDSKFVWLAQKTITSFVKEEYPLVKKINYLRSGYKSPSQEAFCILSFPSVTALPVTSRITTRS